MHENRNNLLSSILFISYLVFFTSLIFSFRAISSVSIGLILIAGVLKNKIEQKRFFSRSLKSPILILCSLFFILQCISLLYTTDLHQGWKNIRLKSALVLIPLALFCCNYLDERIRKRLLNWYCILLLLAGIIAIIVAFKNYRASGDGSVFVYHALVLIYSGHAVQFSILVFIGLLHLCEMLQGKEFFANKFFHSFLILFFVIFLFLLSSKLVIIFFFIYFIFLMARFFILKSIGKTFIATSITALVIFSILIFSIPNPINSRFRDILGTNFSFLKKETFSPGDYFNGLEFRMLQWRFVPEILQEKNAWLMGVSPGDAQTLLDQKYIATNMYIGTPERGDKGFLGYNTHNEFLESLLQTGFIGLVLFMLIIGSLLKMVWERKRADLSFATIILVIYSFSESVFETQYSLFIFLFFPLFFYQGKISKAA